MKTMKCKDLGGACDEAFRANTFEEIATQSKAHSQKMFESGDEAHANAMKEFFTSMKNPNDMKEWVLAKEKEFDEMNED